MTQYPKRQKYFAQRFIRLITKTAAAMEIGADGAWLLTLIVTQEDAKWYTGPVNFWNEQLFGLLGFASKKPLVKARQKCIDAGWLHYIEGGKGKPGKYWVTIPTGYASLPDGPCDESDGLGVPNGTTNGTSKTDLPVPNGTINGTETERKWNANGSSSLPTPNPSPRSARMPSVDEVKSYCRERGNTVNAEHFHDFYEANGWTQGRGKPIRDWKAAVRTWERNEIPNRKSAEQTSKPRSGHDIEEVML